MSLFELENVSVKFENGNGGIQALKKVSLSVEEGEFVSILGPSGCGKTTLLRVLAGLLSSTNGAVKTDDLDCSEISLMFQNHNLLPWRNVLRNAVLPMEIRQNKPGEEFYSEARKLLRMLGLSGFEEAYPNQLSGGMMQRVALARALIPAPKVLLMDEPFGALDEIMRAKLNIELNKIWRQTGKTVIFVTHSVHEAVFLSERIIVLSERPGKIAGEMKVWLPRKRDNETLQKERFARELLRARKLIQGKVMG